MRGYKIYVETDKQIKPIYTTSKKITNNTVTEIIKKAKSYLINEEDLGSEQEYERLPTEKEFNDFYNEVSDDCSKNEKIIKEYPLIKFEKKDYEVILFCKIYISKEDDDDYKSMSYEKIIIDYIDILTD